MKAFAIVNDSLRGSLLDRSTNSSSRVLSTSDEISHQLKQLIPALELKESGSFFTGDIMAKQAIKTLSKSFNTNSILLDPTCGIGNLLISASEYMPVFGSLRDTIEHWGQRLHGFDLHPEFVECTKLRLIQTAIYRGAKPTGNNLEEIEFLFKNIRIGNIFSHINNCESASHILLNPPYILRALPEDRSWGRGKVNMAAVFVEDVFKHCKKDTRYVAILPDVLRSGSRYVKWRESISSNNTVEQSIIGRFDKKTDVDVFLMTGIIGHPCKNKNNKIKVSTVATKVGDKFDVRIGPLVAYRDKMVGQIHPYIQSKNLNIWDTTESFKYRRTKCTLIKPPFVVINRTSSPSDKHRARATIIAGNQPVAVENHLVILKPKKGGVRICRRLISQLKSESTNQFLNKRIRCRHLTVSAVKEIPWQEKY